MHIHTAPDLRRRRLTDLEVMELAVKEGVRAVVLKSHMFPTDARAALVNEVFKNRGGDHETFQAFGGIALNATVGGINPCAVETALQMGGKIVWLPTKTASNQLRRTGRTGGVESVLDGKPVPQLYEVFDLVKAYDAVLATGHLSPEEIFAVVKAAREEGVAKLVITHPELPEVDLSVEDQKRLVKKYGVLFERCYAHPLGGGRYASNLEINLRAIREVGADSTIISTDSGQMENPDWNESYKEYICFLLKHIPENEVDYMTKANPAMLLGL